VVRPYERDVRLSSPTYCHPTLSRRLVLVQTQRKSNGLYIGLAWWIPRMLLARVYSVFVYQHFAGKVTD
jgi:hypothetical protein